MMARLSIYVDVFGLWYWAKRFGETVGLDNARVDYARLRRLVANGRDVHGCHAFVTAESESKRPGWHKFQRALIHLGYRIHAVERGEHVLGRMVDVMRESWAEEEWTHAAVVTGGRMPPFTRHLQLAGLTELHTFPIQCPAEESAGDFGMHLHLSPEVLAKVH